MADTKLLVALWLLISATLPASADPAAVPAQNSEFFSTLRTIDRAALRPAAQPVSNSWTRFNDAVAKTRPAIVMVASDVGGGAGFIISPLGSVITSAELVEGAGLEGEVAIQFSSGLRLKGRVKSVNTNLNIARIQIDSDKKNWPVVRLGDGASLTEGSPVAILGCPGDETSAVSFANIESRQDGFLFFRSSQQIEVRAPGVRLAANRSLAEGKTLCRSDFARSGAAVIDMNGEVVGVSQAIRSAAGWAPIQGAATDSQNLIAFIATQTLENDRSATDYSCPEIDILNIQKVRLSNGLHGGPVWVEHTGDAPPTDVANRYFNSPLAANPQLEHIVKNGNDTPWWFSASWRGDRHRDKIKDPACFLRGTVAFYLWGNEDPKEQTPGSIKVPHEIQPGLDGAQERADPELARRLIELRWFEHDGPAGANGRRAGRFHRWFNMKMGRELEWFKIGTDPSTRQEIVDETYRPIPTGRAINDLY